jgi:hypothetical protein
LVPLAAFRAKARLDRQPRSACACSILFVGGPSHGVGFSFAVSGAALPKSKACVENNMGKAIIPGRDSISHPSQ